MGVLCSRLVLRRLISAVRDKAPNQKLALQWLNADENQ